MAIKTYKKGDTTKLSENFRVSEFACHGSGCCSTVLIDEKLVTFLQKIRDHFGKPITITSGYRCPTHNAKPTTGGSTGSRHTKGQAADISVQGVAPAEVAKYAESIGIKGIGLYETAKDGHFVHIDTRTTKSFWYGQAQAYRSTFGGAKAELKEDGKWGVDTTKASQKVLGTTVDGIVSNQLERCKQYLPAALETSWEFKETGCSGSGLIRAIQKLVGATKDGHCGKETVKAVQKFLKAGKFYSGRINGILCKDTVIGWQKYLNSRM